MIVGTWVWDAEGHHQVDDWQHALSRCQAGGEGFVWIGMDEPDPDELQRLAQQLHLHSFNLKFLHDSITLFFSMPLNLFGVKSLN